MILNALIKMLSITVNKIEKRVVKKKHVIKMVLTILQLV